MPDTSPTDSAGEPYLPQLLLKGQLDPKTVDMSLHSGQSSAPSSFSASSIRDSLSSMSTAPTSQSHHTPMSTVAEGPARSGPQEGESKSRGLGERARGLMGGRFGSIRGQPPAGPPPLPPPPTAAQSGPSRPSVFGRASSRLSSNPLRPTPNTAPSYPPPSSSLPIPPSLSVNTASQPPPAPSASFGRSLSTAPPDPHSWHERKNSGISQRSTGSSISIPPSPSASAPPISPRTSSLASQRSTLANPPMVPNSLPRDRSDQAEGSGTSGSMLPGRRIPSRQLLQTALDLAQRAVEMDQGNDVIGALMAYREAVARLQAVMDRVSEGRKGKDKDKDGKAEQEGRTLRGIHDAYLARIELLQSYENGERDHPDEGLINGFPAPPDSRPSNSRPSTYASLPSESSLPSAASSQQLSLNSSESSGHRSDVPLAPGERTPRPSVDSGLSSDDVNHIGDFMLADQSFEPFSPVKTESGATPQAGDQNTPSRPSSGKRSSSESLTSRSLAPDYGLTSMMAGSTSTVMLNEAPPLSSMLSNPPPRRESLSSTAALGLGHPTSPPKFSDDSMPAAPTPSSTASSEAPSTPNTSRRHRRQMPSVGIEDEVGLTAADGAEDGGEVEEMMDSQERASTAGDGVSRTHSRAGSIDKSLPPLPTDTPTRTASHSRQSSLSRLGQLISDSTSRGTISQRRLSRNSPNLSTLDPGGPPSPSIPSSRSMAFPARSPGNEASFSNVSTGGQGSSSRSRSKSQPGQRPGDTFQAESADNVPPLPNLRNKASFPSQSQQRYSHARMPSDNLAPPGPGSYRSVSPSSLAPYESSGAMSFSGSLISPVPELQPEDHIHRPFHLLRTIHLSMDPDGPGAYLTGAIHIPSSIWMTAPPSSSRSSMRSGQTGSGGGSGPKIAAQDVKVRIMESLLLHLEIIRHTGAPLLDGPREVGYGVPGVAAPRMGGQAVAGIGQELLSALDGLEDEMDTVYKSFVKAGVAVGAWKGKKASTSNRSWGSKVVRSMDKMTSSKAIDSPDKYVDLLASLCSNIQILNDHISMFTGPCTPAYHYIAEPGYRAIEQRLVRSAEFVRVVLVPFVLDDFKQFFYRYLKAGMRYIED